MNTLQRWKELSADQRLSLLFDLSLAVGSSLDTEENCRNFLNALCEKTGAHCASVWVMPEEPANSAPGNLHPLGNIPDGRCSLKAPLHIRPAWERLKAGEQVVVEHSGTGIARYYRLNDFGLLAFCHPEPEPSLFYEDGELLEQVIHKFAISLEGCLAFQRLRQAEQRLILNSRKQRQIIDTSLDAVILIDGYARVVEWGHRAEEMFGYSEREVLGKLWYRFIRLPEEWEKLDRGVEHFQRSGRFQIQPMRILERNVRSKDGRVFTAEQIFSHIELNGEHVFCVYLRDITERKKAEADLVNTRTRLESLIGNLQAGVLVEDENRQIMLANQFFCDLFRLPVDPSLLVGMDCSDAAEQSKHLFRDPAGFIDRLNQLLREKIPVAGEILYLADGRIVERDYIPVFTQENYLGHMWHYRDITQRKRAEDELIEAKQAAEAAKQNEQLFLATMSHEIRTPMNSVIGMTCLLDETPLTSQQREYIDALKFSAESLLGIINNVLDLSKIEAGETLFEKHPFHLPDLLRSLQQNFQLKLKNKPVAVNLFVDPGLDRLVIGDYTRLNQILTNLLGNAAKFTDAGRIDLEVFREDETEDEYRLKFVVRDTGIGIPPDKLSLVFKHFKQGDPETARKFGGTGLGLSIVKQLVELQGGSIHLESSPGSGSTFRFVLPFGKSFLTLEEWERHSFHEEEPDPGSDLEKMRVLAVEDNYMNQKLLQKILMGWGCDLRLATTGQEAVWQSHREKYDLILMDLHMPELDGLEAARQIRTEPDNPNRCVPIIALTAAVFQKDKKDILAAGMNDFLPKPFLPRDLREILLRWRSREVEVDLYPASSARKSPGRLREDFPFLHDLGGGDEAFILDMIGTFLREAPPMLQRMEDAGKRKNYPQVSFQVHLLKPNLEMMGLEDLHRQALQLEKMAKAGAGKGPEIEPALDRLVSGLAAAISGIEKKFFGYKT